MSPSAPDPSPPLSPAEEAAIIDTCAQGDLSAFAALYDAYVTPIYRFAYYRTFAKELAEDLTSQTFLKAIEGIRTFDAAKGNFGAWLYRIARNVVTDHFRSVRPTEILEDDAPFASADDPHGDADKRLRFTQIRRALADLDPLKRDIVMLRLWDGLSYREIAAVVGKSEGNCKVIFSRTVDSLRSRLHPAAFLLLLFFVRL